MSYVEENKKNLFYRPDINYDKNYDTEYIEETEELSLPLETESKIDSIKQHIIEIQRVLPMLPVELANMAINSLKPIESMLEDIENIDSSSTPNEDIVFIIPESKPTPDPESDDPNKPSPIPPTSFFRPDPDPFIVPTGTRDPIVRIKEEYNYDLISIIEDYVDKITGALNNYFNKMLVILKPLDKEVYSKAIDVYTGNTADVSKNFKHLSDLVIRSQLARDMRIRMYNKKYTLDNSITHIRTCKIGMEQRIRYYEAEYTNGQSYADTISDRFLESSRMMYDQKYKQNFINLYKYLNSSVILYNECLNMHLNEIQAKSILLMKEGNDLW